MDARKHHHSYDNGGATIVAVTDPGKSVEALAHHDDFREVFLNPPDIGGRYSALTYVGLVPASLIGLDLDALLASATTMLGACRQPDPPPTRASRWASPSAPSRRPAATSSRSSSTTRSRASAGGWSSSSPRAPASTASGSCRSTWSRWATAGAYGPDRVFVRIALTDGTAGSRTTLADRPRGRRPSGHPDHRQRPDRPRRRVRPLGGRDGHRRRRPRHRPVRPAQRRGSQAADPDRAGPARTRRRRPRQPIATGDGLTLLRRSPLGDGTGDVVAALAGHLARRRDDAYLCLQAFIAPSAEADAAFARIRALLRDRTGRATTAGYGPRFLHSTGQLHKGGTPSGWFLQLTSDHPADRPIPGWPYTFGQLIDGQAAGDLAAIESHGLPILRVHLGSDVAAGLAALERALAAALDTTAATPVTEA